MYKAFGLFYCPSNLSFKVFCDNMPRTFSFGFLICLAHFNSGFRIFLEHLILGFYVAFGEVGLFYGFLPCLACKVLVCFYAYDI